MKPERVIEGQGTYLSRTMHGIAYDNLHDEIVIPVALSGAVLVFKADASGEVPPARIIQGTRTRLVRPPLPASRRPRALGSTSRRAQHKKKENPRIPVQRSRCARAPPEAS